MRAGKRERAESLTDISEVRAVTTVTNRRRRPTPQGLARPHGSHRLAQRNGIQVFAPVADTSVRDTKQDDVLLTVLMSTLDYHTLPIQFCEEQTRIAARINLNIVKIPAGKKAALLAEKPFQEFNHRTFSFNAVRESPQGKWHFKNNVVRQDVGHSFNILLSFRLQKTADYFFAVHFQVPPSCAASVGRAIRDRVRPRSASGAPQL